PAMRLPARATANTNSILGKFQTTERSGTQGEFVGFYSEALQHRQEKIAERRASQSGLRERLVFAVLESAAGEDERQIVVGMRVSVTHAAPEQDHGAGEQRNAAIVDGFQLAQEADELLRLIFVQ